MIWGGGDGDTGWYWYVYTMCGIRVPAASAPVARNPVPHMSTTP